MGGATKMMWPEGGSFFALWLREEADSLTYPFLSMIFTGLLRQNRNRLIPSLSPPGSAESHRPAFGMWYLHSLPKYKLTSMQFRPLRYIHAIISHVHILSIAPTFIFLINTRLSYTHSQQLRILKWRVSSLNEG